MVGTLDLITSNPAVDAYQKAEKLALEQDKQDQEIRSSIRDQNEKATTLPTRLRALEATTSSSETKAQTDKAEAPFAGPTAGARLRQIEAGTDSTVASTANTKLTPFYKSVEMLHNGDVEGAQTIAAAAGLTIPDEFINNADMRSSIKQAADEAQKQYPNRPKDQQAYIKGAIQSAIERRQNGGRAADPTVAYNVPDAPVPQESTDFKSRFEPLAKTRINPETGKEETGYVPFDRSTGEEGDFVPGAVSRGGRGGAGSERKITGTEAIIGELRKENPTLSYQDALGIAKRSGQSTDVLTLRREAIALSAAKGDINYATNPSQTIDKYRKQYGIGATPAPAATPPNIVGPNETITRVDTTPAPVAPASVAQPGQMSPGDGTKPLNIQLPPTPPNVPPGSQYSPSRRMWKDASGRVYDENGTPVVTQ